MLHKTLLVIFALTVPAFWTTAEARAWGPARHVGFTHIGPGGIQHWGRTSFGGGYGGVHYGAYGAYGGYRGGYGAVRPYGYGGYGYGGYHYGGYGYGYNYGGYRAGYYRAW
jgi:hypothetical protein